MKKLAVALAVVVNGFVNAQDPVYVIGEDSTSWVLYSGVGEKILNQYKLSSGSGIVNAIMIDSIKSYLNDSSLILHTVRFDGPYTKLNTELVFESHIIHTGFDMIMDPHDRYFIDSLFANFKSSHIILDREEEYIVTYDLVETYQPGTEVIPSYNIEWGAISRHLIFSIRRILK